MKFEQNKINLYLGAGYLILGLLSLISNIQPSLLLALSTAGLCFSLSLLALAIEHTLMPAQEEKPEPVSEDNLLESIEAIQKMVNSKRKPLDTLRYAHLAGAVFFMAGFVFLVALAGFNLSEGFTTRLTTFSYITSIGVLFVAFYLEERLNEKARMDGEKEVLNRLLDQARQAALALKEKKAPAQTEEEETQQPPVEVEVEPEPIDLTLEEDPEIPVLPAPALSDSQILENSEHENTEPEKPELEETAEEKTAS